jgi:hypothetical protein
LARDWRTWEKRSKQQLCSSITVKNSEGGLNRDKGIQLGEGASEKR